MSRLTPLSVFNPPFQKPAVFLALLILCRMDAHAIDADTTVSIAEKEVKRRADLISSQVPRLSQADAMAQAGDTAGALAQYEDIYQKIPDLPMTQELRAAACEGYLQAGLRRAGELSRAGDLAAALKILDQLDRPDVAKGHREIVRLRQLINDPDRFPPALTPDHVQRVQEVQRLLTLAASQHETGMYDQALASYEEVLRLDATNSAARRGMEKVENARAHYFEAARDHQRSKMLNEVNSLWDLKTNVKPEDISGLFGGEPAGSKTSAKNGRESLAAKLRDIKIERIDFTGAALEEVLEYLRVRSRDLDPTGKGVDFVMGVPKEQVTRTVSLNLTNVPIEEVLRYVVEVAGVSYRIEEFAVRIVSLTDTTKGMISKSYRVPPDFITASAVDPAAGATAPADPFAVQNAAAPAGGAIMRRLGAKEFLESRGVTFPDDASASYNPVINMLLVRNTAKNIELVDMLVEQSLNSSPKMAVIEVKIVEINSTKLDEMGFDWLLEGFGSDIEFAGGTTGNAQKTTFGAEEFPINAALSATGMAPVTAGLRSSGNLQSNRSIEDVLYGAVESTSKRSPGILSLAGVLTNPQFQVVWRALDQKTGVDLMARPSVVTKNGQKATVEIVREFIYPTEYDPPQIPTNVGGANNNAVVIGPTSLPPIPVTPTTPTAFETRRVGVVLDVEPAISEDGRAIDLTITPEFTEFVGFVNYGSPIYSVQPLTNAAGFITGSSKQELTPNIITQPIFSTKKVVTGVKVYDGSTVVLGGLITDQSIIIDDKVPVIGDLPFVGRLFQSKVKQRRTKNIIMFVTVKVVDPSGNRINPQ